MANRFLLLWALHFLFFVVPLLITLGALPSGAWELPLKDVSLAQLPIKCIAEPPADSQEMRPVEKYPSEYCRETLRLLTADRSESVKSLYRACFQKLFPVS
jgi:hypothetical protein